MEWEGNKEALKALKWVPRGTKQAVVKPVMGLGTSPVLTDTGVGHFNSVFSGPSLFEVGESSLAGEGKSAQASLTVVCPKALPQSFDLELGVSDQCAKPPLEADGPFSAGTSSDEPMLPLGKADGPSSAGTSYVEPPLPPGKAVGPFSVGTSSDEPMLPPGKSDKVFSRSSVECFLSDFFLSLSRAGLVVLGDNDRDEGGWDNCTNFRLKDVLELKQPSLAVLPTKALFVVLGASALAEEGLNIPDMGLGGEDSLSIPLLSITPFGLPLSAKLNCGNEAVVCVNMLDISRWVKNRLPGFSKLVGLPLSRHKKLFIALLQKIEREMEAAKVLNRKVTVSRKVVIYKDKGKRELRNLQSSVNYDGR